MVDLLLQFLLTLAGTDHQSLQLFVLAVKIGFFENMAANLFVLLSIDEDKLVQRVTALLVLDLAADSLLKLHLQQETVLFLFLFEVFADGLAEGAVFAVPGSWFRLLVLECVGGALDEGRGADAANRIIKLFHFITLGNRNRYSHR